MALPAVRFVALVAVALGSSAVAAPVPKAVKKQSPLDGTWEVVEWYSNGNKVNAAATTIRWTIDGENLTIDRLANNRGVIIRKAANPPVYTLVKAEGEGKNAVDYTITYNGGARTVTYPGLFETDGDDLKFCYGLQGKSRPAECKAEETNVLYVFKRVAAEVKDK
jgi:uncharacterized protein (TIGR03067 family)